MNDIAVVGEFGVVVGSIALEQSIGKFAMHLHVTTKLHGKYVPGIHYIIESNVIPCMVTVSTLSQRKSTCP